MVADQAPDQVTHTVVVAGFYPRDGRSLLDDWGSDDAGHTAERTSIEQAGMIWAPPATEGLDADPGLNADQARWLGQRLVPHPGHTIVDPVAMQTPITEQPVTVVANVGDGDPSETLPDNLRGEVPDEWTMRTIPAGWLHRDSREVIGRVGIDDRHWFSGETTEGRGR